MASLYERLKDHIINEAVEILKEIIIADYI